MIFQELTKLKRTTVMIAIVLIAIGVLMLICPEEYMTIMIGTLGDVMLIAAVLGILEFISSNRSMIRFVYLTGWIIMGIVGTAVMLFEIDTLYTVGWLFGAVLILGGLSNITIALVYAKRSGRKGWWILILLALLEIACGVIIFINPWWNTASKLFKVVGGMVLFSSFVVILRLIWLWPINRG